MKTIITRQRSLTLDADLKKADKVVRKAKKHPKKRVQVGRRSNLEVFYRIKVSDPKSYEDLRSRLCGVMEVDLDDLLEPFIVEATGLQEKNESTVPIVKKLAASILGQSKLGCDDNGEAFIEMDLRTHHEIYKVSSRQISEYISMVAFKEFGECVSEATVSNISRLLSAHAKYDGERVAPQLRIAKQDGRHLIDIGDPLWRVIEVSSEGYRTLEKLPVSFYRTDNMRSLPIPTEPDLKKLWLFVNVKPKDRIFILAFILECLRKGTIFPVLELVGEQGTAKSFTQNVCRELTDPNKVALRSAPKSTEELFISAGQSSVVSLNNMSFLKADMQDAICVLSTGGGISSRKLYTNDEELVINVMRPCMMNGISPIATAPDLVDRTIRLELPEIKDKAIPSELEAKFESAKPEIFAGVLRLFSRALKFMPEARKYECNDRMADFIILGFAILLSMGREANFANLYAKKKLVSFTQGLESSPAMLCLIKYVEKSPYSGTYGRLLDKLLNCYPRARFPKSPRGLSDLLRRHAPVLRKLGLVIKHHPKRKKDGYHVDIYLKS